MSNKHNFEWGLIVLDHHEGTFSNHSDDPGGVTNFGISLRFLQSVLEDADQDGFADGDIDRDGDIDADDVRGLSISEAHKLYEKKFWKAGKCDKIKSGMIAVKLFDMAVNMGPSQAWRLMQAAINTLGLNIKVDGKAGPKTLEAVNSLTDRDFMLVTNVRREQDRFYDELIKKRSSLESFRLGWRRRAAF